MPLKFSRMETASPAELIFGCAKRPLSYGIGLKVGSGQVVPELKYFTKSASQGKTGGIKDEFVQITSEVLQRASELGVPSLQLETEFTFVETSRPIMVGEITSAQKALLEKHCKDHGVAAALRTTIADMRDPRHEGFDADSRGKMMESFEAAASGGADVLSIESEGGKDVFNHAVVRQDLAGVVFALGVLAPIDMRRLWRDIVGIATRTGVIPGGDTACAFGNTALRLAGGVGQMTISHVFAAVVRAMSASRSLVAYEEGAKGPGKDCGYENVILKAITGYPMSMEGKTSASAHSSLVGNVSSAACDLWSNEQVQNDRMFSGSAPQAFLEMLHYDTKLMNQAQKEGKALILRDLLVNSDKFSDPQAFVLAPDIAWCIGEAMVSESGDQYRRTVKAGEKALDLILVSTGLVLSESERRFGLRLKRAFGSLPAESEDFVAGMISTYTGKVSTFRPRDYEL